MSQRSRQRAKRYAAAKKRASASRTEQQASDRQPADDQATIGWFAYHGQGVLCEGAACVIAGSPQALSRRTGQEPHVAWQVRATTFEEIFAGISKGGAYAFDDEAYERFYPLASQRGLPLAPPMPVEPPPGCSAEDHLVHVRFMMGGF